MYIHCRFFYSKDVSRNVQVPCKKKEVAFNHAHREMMFEEYLYLISLSYITHAHDFC